MRQADEHDTCSTGRVCFRRTRACSYRAAARRARKERRPVEAAADHLRHPGTLVHSRHCRRRRLRYLRCQASQSAPRSDGATKIETPFGNIEAEDPAKAAEKMGIDVYPGAEAVKNGSGSFSMGDFSAGSAAFQTTDSIDQVAAFYKEQYPRAIHSESNGAHSFSVNSKDKVVVITLQEQGSKTSITLSQVVAPKSR